MEIMKNTYVFQTDDALIQEQLHQPNYLIEYTDSNEQLKEKYCVVYFSSNNIYFPNTAEVFRKDIINKNKFEWYGLRIKKGSKHIFIRDIQKQWYLHGINSEINSIEKINEFLKNETKGYKVIMLGSSSGGYAASLFGSLLKVEHVISFNGQFQLLDLLKTSSQDVDPILFRERDNIEINKYFSLRSIIAGNSKIYYMYSNKSSWDIANKEHIEDLDIPTISFTTKNHGIPFVKSALPYVINADIRTYNKWLGNIYNPLLFSFKYGGFWKTMYILLLKAKEIFTKKINFIF